MSNRIWMLIENPIPPQALQRVRLKALAWDGIEKHISVPMNHVKKQDANIHQLAAKSLLDDLEYKKIQLYTDPDFQSHVDWEKQNRVHEQAEQIAIEWSIASK